MEKNIFLNIYNKKVYFGTYGKSCTTGASCSTAAISFTTAFMICYTGFCQCQYYDSYYLNTTGLCGKLKKNFNTVKNIGSYSSYSTLDYREIPINRSC